MSVYPLPQVLARAWIDRYTTVEKFGDNSPEARATFSAFEKFNTLCSTDPEFAWATVLEVLAETKNEFVLENLAAGPLEKLLEQHGEVLIDRVEKLALDDSRFRWLLAGVWRGSIENEIWMRLQQAVSDVSEE